MVLHQPEFKVKNRVKIAANPRKLIYNLFIRRLIDRTPAKRCSRSFRISRDVKDVRFGVIAN
jgi:hypothetical protein